MKKPLVFHCKVLVVCPGACEKKGKPCKSLRRGACGGKVGKSSNSRSHWQEGSSVRKQVGWANYILLTTADGGGGGKSVAAGTHNLLGWGVQKREKQVNPKLLRIFLFVPLHFFFSSVAVSSSSDEGGSPFFANSGHRFIRCGNAVDATRIPENMEA